MIMHVITNFTGRAGAETMLARLLNASSDPRVMVVPLIGVSEANRAIVKNPAVVYAPLNAAAPWRIPGAIVRLAGLIRREKPRVLLCWMYHAMAVGSLAARLSGTGVPVVWNVRQSLDDPASFSRSTRIALSVTRRLSNMPDGIIYNSSRARRLHAAYGYADAEATVIPNGFELPELAGPRPREARLFGLVGRFHPQKDHETFFKAAAIAAGAAPDMRFATAGEGVTADSPAIAALLTAAGLAPERIDMKGLVLDMAGFYRSIDVLVLSSRTEGFPNVVAEAMSHGRPVVTTDVGDAAEIVGDAGRVVQARDPAALAAAMIDLYRMAPADYEALAGRARTRIEENYELSRVVARYDAYLADRIAAARR
jgi:glycosyltransferase involved in cell wall biosynthesis